MAGLCVCGGGGGVFVFFLWVCVCVCVLECVRACVRICYCSAGKRENRKDSADSHLSRQLDTHPRVRTTLVSVAVRTLNGVSSIRISRCTVFSLYKCDWTQVGWSFSDKIKNNWNKDDFFQQFTLLSHPFQPSTPTPSFCYSFVFWSWTYI